jgi:2-dehydro-3-deoxygluconokinase
MGEAMLTVAPARVGPLAQSRHADLSMAGAEATVAIGVRRLGHRTTWVSRLGDDAAGELVRNRLRGEGVQVVAATGPGPTGLMIKERPRAHVRHVSYYRTGSAAAALSVADVPESLDAAVVHVSGITPALSDSARQATRALVERARAAGALVSLDVNYRSALWSPAAAGECLRGLVRHADVAFAGVDEAALVLGTPDRDPARLAAAVQALGPATAVVTDGPRGSVLADETGVSAVPAVATVEVDPFGAGDAFVAGFLATVLDGGPPLEAVRRAAHVAALAVAAEGDWEGLPTAADLVADDRDIRR